MAGGDYDMYNSTELTLDYAEVDYASHDCDSHDSPCDVCVGEGAACRLVRLSLAIGMCVWVRVACLIVRMSPFLT